MKPGDRKGQFVYVRAVGTRRDCSANRTVWLVRCDCAREYERTSNCVGSGGCVCRLEKHGMNRTKEHKAWLAIRGRCLNPNNQCFPLYGGRGISMSQEWNTFVNFYNDMGPAPSPEHTIDRIDPNGDYTKHNCRWATRREQANNTRNNIIIDDNGTSKTLSTFCRDHGLPYKKAWNARRAGLAPCAILELFSVRAGEVADRSTEDLEAAE